MYINVKMKKKKRSNKEVEGDYEENQMVGKKEISDIGKEKYLINV